MNSQADRTCARRTWTSEHWADYFSANAASLVDIPWDCGAGITDEEGGRIRESIRGFQLGESSEGRHLLRVARAYAERSGDRGYVNAVQLFIAEEQRHARDLARFMRIACIPRLRKTWPDSVFRLLRRMGGLEVSVSVLLAAEIIAKVYYAALRSATCSVVLQRLCDQILQDEVEHIRFQCERLAILRARRSEFWLRISHWLHEFLFLGTCPVVWLKHGRALKAGGYHFRRFWQVSWHEMRQALHVMRPALYALPDHGVTAHA